MPSVWHRPQCDIGPEISPVTISTMDESRKRPGSPEPASSTRRRGANDEMNAHRMLGAITAAVVVVTAVTSSVTHTMLSLPISGGASMRDVVASTERITVKTSTSAAPTVLGVSTGCLSRPSKNLQTYCIPCSRSTSPSRPPFPRTPLDEMLSCIHQQCCTERESLSYRQLRTPRSPIA